MVLVVLSIEVGIIQRRMLMFGLTGVLFLLWNYGLFLMIKLV